MRSLPSYALPAIRRVRAPLLLLLLLSLHPALRARRFLIQLRRHPWSLLQRRLRSLTPPHLRWLSACYASARTGFASGLSFARGSGSSRRYITLAFLRLLIVYSMTLYSS